MPQKDYSKATSESHDKTIQSGISLMSHVQDINQDFKEQETEKKAKQLRMPYVNLLAFPVNPEHLRMVPLELAQKANAAPFYLTGKRIKVATIEPGSPNLSSVTSFLEQKGFKIELFLVTKEGFATLMNYYNSTDIHADMREIEGGEVSGKTYEDEVESLSQLEGKLDSFDENVLLQKILIGAVSSGASDIHFQPEKEQTLLRLRIDGLLHKIFEVPSDVYDKILTKIKFVAGMKLNIGYKPQDGKISFTASGRRIDVRVSTLPTEYGEALVMRLLDSKKARVEIETLGFSEINKAFLMRAIEKTEGMILVTGPTGSGKTTTLYALLSKLNTPETKIITLEDPIEYQVEGISQSQIHEADGYTFALGLRAILRQDPNVIMLGEIRDTETASIAVQSSLTGHIVLSTVHANSAVEAVNRMLNMDVERYLLAPALNLLAAQRLARKVCTFCSKTRSLTEDEKNILKGVIERIQSAYPDFEKKVPEALPEVVGCAKCSKSGYLGQVACSEILEVSRAMRGLILDGVSDKALHEEAVRAGMISMREDGMLKVIDGVTTLEEILRVTEER